MQHTSATATFRAAVLAERARLSADIESYVGELVSGIGRRASAALAATDPSADIAWIQNLAQDATASFAGNSGCSGSPMSRHDRRRVLLR